MKPYHESWLYTFGRVMCLLCALWLAACRSASAPLTVEQKVAWLEQHAVRLRSIDPADDDLADLQPLKQILGDARMVLLGEISHGDGGAFLAKTRLIRFLHQEMGFDVLAFESGLYDCARAWELLQTGEDAARAFQGGVFSVWAASEQVQPLVEYLAEMARSDRPLVLAGFDDQFTGNASATYLIGDLVAFLEGLGLPAQSRAGWADFAAILDDLTRSTYQSGQKLTPGAARRALFLETLAALRADVRLAAGRADREAAFWVQVLDNIASHAQGLWKALDSYDLTVAAQMRDEQMGRNLLWLANDYYRERKIVVWAANMHIARNVSQIEVADAELQATYRQLRLAGDYVWQELGRQVYVLAATAYTGATAAAYKPRFDVPPASAGSLEDLMNRAGLETAILDLRNVSGEGKWLREKLVARPFGFTEMTADWSQIVDGLLFMREMTPSAGVK